MDYKLKIKDFPKVTLKKKNFSRNPEPGMKNPKIQGYPGFSRWRTSPVPRFAVLVVTKNNGRTSDQIYVYKRLYQHKLL